jgi:N-terminal domain of reverse transcriptase
MSAAEMPAGAAPERAPDWHSIDWKKVWRTVRRVQARIVKAVAAGRWNKVKALVYLLTHSFVGRALAKPVLERRERSTSAADQGRPMTRTCSADRAPSRS